jgi:hypothetical protein
MTAVIRSVPSGQQARRDREPADQLSRPGEQRGRQRRTNAQPVEPVGGGLETEGAQQPRRVLRRHELLQAVTDEENADHEPQDDKRGVHGVTSSGSSRKDW